MIGFLLSNFLYIGARDYQQRVHKAAQEVIEGKATPEEAADKYSASGNPIKTGDVKTQVEIETLPPEDFNPGRGTEIQKARGRGDKVTKVAAGTYEVTNKKTGETVVYQDPAFQGREQGGVTARTVPTPEGGSVTITKSGLVTKRDKGGKVVSREVYTDPREFRAAVRHVQGLEEKYYNSLVETSKKVRYSTPSELTEDQKLLYLGINPRAAIESRIVESRKYLSERGKRMLSPLISSIRKEEQKLLYLGIYPTAAIKSRAIANREKFIFKRDHPVRSFISSLEEKRSAFAEKVEGLPSRIVKVKGKSFAEGSEDISAARKEETKQRFLDYKTKKTTTAAVLYGGAVIHEALYERLAKPVLTKPVSTTLLLYGGMKFFGAFPKTATTVYVGLSGYDVSQQPTVERKITTAVGEGVILGGFYSASVLSKGGVPTSFKKLLKFKQAGRQTASRTPKRGLRQRKPTSKAQLSKRSLQQASDPRVFVDVQSKSVGVRLRSQELKQQFTKERVVTQHISGDVTVADKPVGGGKSLVTELATGRSRLASESTPRKSKLYPKGFGGQAVRRTIDTQNVVGVAVKSKLLLGTVTKEGVVKFPKRQPISKLEPPQTGRLVGVSENIKSLDVTNKVSVIVPKRQPISDKPIPKGFRKGMKERILERMKPAIQESRVRVFEKAAREKALVPVSRQGVVPVIKSEVPTIAKTPFSSVGEVLSKKKKKLRLPETVEIIKGTTPAKALTERSGTRVYYPEYKIAETKNLASIEPSFLLGTKRKVEVDQGVLVQSKMGLQEYIKTGFSQEQKSFVSEDLGQVSLQELKSLSSQGIVQLQEVKSLQKPAQLPEQRQVSSRIADVITSQKIDDLQGIKIIEGKDYTKPLKDINLIREPRIISDDFGGRKPFEPPKKPPPEIPILPSTVKTRSFTKSYTVFVRKKGKFVAVGTRTSPESAFELGKQAISSTAAASFKIKGEEGYVPVSRFGLGRRLRAGKRSKTTFIQKRKFRISTAGEKSEITLKGLATLKKRRSKKGFSIF